MRLIGRGRDCDVFDAGPGKVLRRSRLGPSLELEADPNATDRERGG